MDLARRVYTRELKVAAMRELDGGCTVGQVARQREISPNLLQRWKSEWRARGELAFPGEGRRGLTPQPSELQRIADLERKIGQLTMENDFLKRALQHFREPPLPAVVGGAAACLPRSAKPPRKARRPQ